MLLVEQVLEETRQRTRPPWQGDVVGCSSSGNWGNIGVAVGVQPRARCARPAVKAGVGHDEGPADWEGVANGPDPCLVRLCVGCHYHCNDLDGYEVPEIRAVNCFVFRTP